MALYLIGDVQGCDEALGRLLQTVAYSPSRDTLFLLGDLVNRGPASLAVLRRLAGLGGSVRCVLGNHDLHLLAAAWGTRALQAQDTLDALLAAPDRNALLDWLRNQRLAMQAHGCLMVHAGVLPAWDAADTVALAAEVEQALRGPDIGDFLRTMYGNRPDRWDPALAGADRLRLVVNALTRLRFCTPDGRMEFKTKGGPNAAPPGCLPWFDVPGRRTAGTLVACGHWSTLGWLERPDLLALDTGCVWGGCLTAVRLDPATGRRERIQVRCEQAQAPADE